MTTPTTGDKALSYVPQIMAACAKVIDQTKGSLTYAIQAGELLNSAKAALPKRVGWERWLGQNLPDIPPRTANLYMRLATHKTQIDRQRVAAAIEDGSLSIRAAAKFIPQSETAKAAAEKRKATLAANKAAEASKTIEGKLQDLAVDDVYSALKNSMAVDDLLELGHMILDRNERNDSVDIPAELDRRPTALPASPPPASSKPAEQRRTIE
jgi:hypothetical protein